MATHELGRTDVILHQLAEELAAMIGSPVAINMRNPGQRGGDGRFLPGVLQILDPATGEPIEVDAATVAQVVRNHKPRPILSLGEELAKRAEGAVTLDDLKAVIAGLARMPRLRA